MKKVEEEKKEGVKINLFGSTREHTQHAKNHKNKKYKPPAPAQANYKPPAPTQVSEKTRRLLTDDLDPYVSFFKTQFKHLFCYIIYFQNFLFAQKKV